MTDPRLEQALRTAGKRLAGTPLPARLRGTLIASTPARARARPVLILLTWLALANVVTGGALLLAGTGRWGVSLAPRPPASAAPPAGAAASPRPAGSLGATIITGRYAVGEAWQQGRSACRILGAPGAGTRLRACHQAALLLATTADGFAAALTALPRDRIDDGAVRDLVATLGGLADESRAIAADADAGRRGAVADHLDRAGTDEWSVQMAMVFDSPRGSAT